MQDGDGKFTCHLKNSGATNSLDYQVLSYADYEGTVPYTEVSGTLAAGDMVQIALTTKKVARLKVQVKSTTAGSATTYIAESIMAY